VRRAIIIIISTVSIVVLILGAILLIRTISKCPAIMLAANRTARVPGRMMFLTVSMHTMNGIRAGGVPWGTKWANMC